ncbi:D-cysteine desulfhydrase family protein [Novispirillum itersonii]|uniref:D-cysteine desulfhydrase family protein n=1 Tax=Novispirillum itersonii TaxID=189 RepID=UPI00037CEA60|nr:D-cysteine desulfhydrase family protein [Novispirillum itersonii]
MTDAHHTPDHDHHHDRYRAAAAHLRHALQRFPRFPLVTPGTGSHTSLPSLSADLGITLTLMRDDVGAYGGGGNKLRKLEYLLGAALDQGARTVITVGAVQSNHCRLTAAACRRAGLEPHLVLVRMVPNTTPDYVNNGNVLLDMLAGAVIHYVDTAEEARAEIATLMQTLDRPYFIPAGGSNPTGGLGYVQAVAEILDSGQHWDLVVTTLGSGGTQAGLLAGYAAAGVAQRVLGLSIGYTVAEATPIVATDTAGTLALLGSPAPAPAPWIDDRGKGDGYGIVSPAGNDAISSLIRQEGVFLDPVYTGKAMGALFSAVHDGTIRTNSRVLFLHTGGFPGLFAYQPFLTT